MRLGNLPHGGHDKLTSKRSGDLLTRRRDNITPRYGGDVPQRHYWVFHFGLTGHRGYVPLRCCWVFHLRLVGEVVETY